MTALRRLRRAAIDVEPLRHDDFRRFQLTAVAVPVQVYELTGSSFWVGMLGLVGLVPLVMFGLWGGAVADAVDRRLLLLGSSLTLWGCTGGLLAAALLEVASLPLLLGLVAVQAAGFAVASSTRGAIVPRVLPAELVPAANTLSFTASNLGMVLGPLLARLILARRSFAAAYAADFTVFTIALYAALRLPALPPTGPGTTPGLRSVVDGLAFIATRPVLLLSFAVDIAAMVLAMPRALFPETADQLGGRGTVGWLTPPSPAGPSLPGCPRAGSGGSGARAWPWSRPWSPGGWPWPRPAWPGRCGRSWPCWPWPARPTWSRPCTARPFSRPTPRTRCAGACRGCSSWSWPAGPASATCGPGRPRPPSGSPPPGSGAACWPPPWSPWPCWSRPCATTTPATRFSPRDAIA